MKTCRSLWTLSKEKCVMTSAHGSPLHGASQTPGQAVRKEGVAKLLRKMAEECQEPEPNERSCISGRSITLDWLNDPRKAALVTWNFTRQ